MRIITLMLFVLFSGFALASSGPQEIRQFDNEEQRRLFKELAEELRCPKCQNQNIADSDANIAKDLRNKVFKLVKDGKDKKEVVDFMVDRYGYFVYYKPPVTPGTLILWVFPIFFVLFTMLLIWYKSKRSRMQTEKADWDDEREGELSALIEQIEKGLAVTSQTASAQQKTAKEQ